MNKQQKRRLIHVSILVIIVMLLGTIVLMLPKLGIRYICPFHEYMNIECSGCGGTRMVISVLQGDLRQAFRYNPFMFITSIPLIILSIQQAYKFIITGDFSYWLDKVLITYAIALIAFGIIRNIEIFSWLKPTII